MNITKQELMKWHHTCIRAGHYKTAKLIMSALLKVLPSQEKKGGYLLYIASYDHEPHMCGFAQYVAQTYQPYLNCKGEHPSEDRKAIITNLIRKA